MSVSLSGNPLFGAAFIFGGVIFFVLLALGISDIITRRDEERYLIDDGKEQKERAVSGRKWDQRFRKRVRRVVDGTGVQQLQSFHRSPSGSRPSKVPPEPDLENAPRLPDPLLNYLSSAIPLTPDDFRLLINDDLTRALQKRFLERAAQAKQDDTADETPPTQIHSP